MIPRRGTSLIELLVVLTVVGVIAASAVSSMSSLAASWAVRDAHRRTALLFALARGRAQTSGARTAIAIVPPHRLAVVQGLDTVAQLDLTASDVSVLGTRDSMAYSPSGMAWGASNLRLVFERATARDTLFVSRLGRVR
jgi:prepilin-type N-terminal cleavage/methylation domain-containing protein